MRLRPSPTFRGRFRLPGDKSLSHRLALFAGMADGPTSLRHFSSAADCASTLACLGKLGVQFTHLGTEVQIEGRGLAAWHAPAGPLDAGNSGSTLRMLAGVLAGRPFRSVLDGDASLRGRPVERVATPLRAMGARVETREGKPPLVIEGGALRAIDWKLQVASAQVKTAVLLAGLQATGTTSVTEPELSRDHTERLLPAFGVPVERDGLCLRVTGGTGLRGGRSFEVPGDPSSAAFLVVAALVLPDAAVEIEEVCLNPTRTAFLEVLQSMGGQIETGLTEREPEPVGFIRARSSRLRGVEVPAHLIPSLIDEVPVLVTAAALAEGPFLVTGASELRVKESDRIATMTEGLSRMGAEVEERPDGLLVRGGKPLQGARVEARGDHRIAMALAIAALAATGESEILDSECAAVSFPEFFDVLAEATAGARP
jgi:3-phosphoshikimate 1-carboxyvinyltransferase